ncbi:MAG: GntR family transcriptional regulator [Opitutaceae bacterium]|nr:GntR family transcriptional regulator [Opitutaceae bacterium]
MKIVNSDIAYDYIRKRILSGEYPSGKALITDTLSAEIGVSRTPVRDALRQLEADGLVSIKPHLGASVKSLDYKELRELCELRLALESHAAGLAARHRTVEDLHEIRYALQAMRGLTEQIIAAKTEQPLLTDLIREDIRFHVAIMAAAKNDLIKKEILRLHLVHRIVSGNETAVGGEKPTRDVRRRAVMASHEAIFDAVERQDVAAARHEMDLHIQDIIDSSLLIKAQAQKSLAVRELTEEELKYIV